MSTDLILLASAAAISIFAAGILVLVYNSKKNEVIVGCPRLSLSLMSSIQPLIIIKCRVFINTHWVGEIIKFGSTSNMATDLIRQIVVAVLLLAIAHSSYLFVRQQLPALNFPKLRILMPK